jgi:hypothetical protein
VSSQEFSREEAKSESHKSPETFTKKQNLLGMSEVNNYNELPGAFEVGEEFTDAVTLLRHRTETEKTEVGGVLTKDQEGKLGFKTAGEKGDIFALSMVQITDENKRFFTEERVLCKQDGKPTLDIAFVPKKIADNNSQYFKNLVDMGTEVVLDRVPAGRLHSHPSGNLPSPVDFGHVVAESGFSSSKSIPEIIVTSEYTYMLFPTKQTKNLSDDQMTKNGVGMAWGWGTEEAETAKRLGEIDEANGIKNQDKNAHFNALRYNFLRSRCMEHNVGFYALKNGEKTAQRVF